MAEPGYSIEKIDQRLTLRLKGDWSIGNDVPEFPEQDIEGNGPINKLSLIDAGIEDWDSMLMVFVRQSHRWCEQHGIALDVQGMPPAIAKLLDVSTAVTRYEPPSEDQPVDKWARFGLLTLRNTYLTFKELLDFMGKFSITLIKFLRGKSDTRMVDVTYFIEQVGPKGLGIVTLISILVGMILAYLSLVQLRQLGAQLYVADLVGVGMTREMGALMTGVILAGRTGAAYAAQLGTMQVNEEIDAIKTMAMSSMEFLVLPRMLALLIIMPLLVIYSNFLGMFGGALIATGTDVTLSQYIQETQRAVELVDFFCGFLKSIFFAILIGIAGCQAGLQCGRDSTAVGHATTKAVVRAIVYLIIADLAFNILYDKMGI